MAWLRGKVSLGSFPDLAGAVNKISESVKNIENHFDNALGLEEQPGGGSISTVDASHSWSPEFMAFAQDDGNGKSSEKLESSSHGNVTAESSKKHESSEKDESLEETESSEKHESSKELESSTHPSFSKEKEGVDVDDSTNITEDHLSPVREASAEIPKLEEEHHVLSNEKEGVDAGDTTSMEEHSMPVREARIESIKPEEHQPRPLEKNIAIPEEVNNSAVKPMDTNTVIGEKAEGILGLPEEAQNIAKKPINIDTATSHEATAIADNHIEAEADSQAKPSSNDVEESESLDHAQHRENTEIGSPKVSGPIEDESTKVVDHVATTSPELQEVHVAPDLQKSDHEVNNPDTKVPQENSVVEGVDATYDGQSAMESKPHQPQSPAFEVIETIQEGQPRLLSSSDDVSEAVSNDVNENAEVHRADQLAGDDQRYEKEQHKILESNMTNNADSTVELETLKKEMKKMDAALLGAARQAQAKADEISKLMNENEQLKSIIEDQRRKSNESEMDSLREEYHQRVATLERKVYALTRERDTLRREQNKRNDSSALLKEKDEIITQVMAEGEELSKKQAVQESTIRRLRAQIREFDEEKKGLISKIQAEENKVENLKNEKATTEKVLQETIEKNQSELSTQKEYYITTLNVAKEAKAQAEAQANDEARTEQESRLKEAGERESMLVQTLEELRQTLIRKEQQQVYREDMLRKDINDLQKRYQASERRCEELVMQVPESTRPLLRQIEAMQERTARKAEAWAAVERSLNIRLQDAEARAASTVEKDRAVNERLSQTLSRINVLEAQISCLRSEQTQLSRSLEKERQKASESRQEYLAIKEEADTHKGHVNQLQEEMRELKRKHKRELQEALTQRELLQQDIEREKAARLELEKTPLLGQGSLVKTKSISENGLTRRLSSASSISSMEESFFLQASLDPSNTFSETSPRVPVVTPYYFRSMTTPNAFQAALRQKEGELKSYMSRLASMESIRDSLTEELVKLTKECEKLRSEVVLLPSIKAELEALRIRHSAALELMGERDEELEELRADIVDVKEMYREQVNMLVNKIQKGSSIAFA